MEFKGNIAIDVNNTVLPMIEALHGCHCHRGRDYRRPAWAVYFSLSDKHLKEVTGQEFNEGFLIPSAKSLYEKYLLEGFGRGLLVSSTVTRKESGSTLRFSIHLQESPE